MRKFTSLLLLGFALGSFAQTPGGVSGSELWFKTAPLNSDLQGYYRWQDFSGDSIRLMLLDSRGVKSELTLPDTIRPTINKLNMEQVKSIFYKEIAYPYSNNQYGLAIIIMMQKKCLYFDSSSFYFVKSPSDNFNKQKWNIVSDLNDNKIAAIHEDELSAYFILFTNSKIMYIYQELDGNECIRQMFRIVNPNDKDYQEIVQYMNEKWVETLYDEYSGIDNIMNRDIFQLTSKLT